MIDSLNILAARVDSLASQLATVHHDLDWLRYLNNWQTTFLVAGAGAVLVVLLFMFGFTWYDRRAIDKRIGEAQKTLKEESEASFKKADARHGMAFNSLYGEIARITSAQLRHTDPSGSFSWSIVASCRYALAGDHIMAKEMSQDAEKWLAGVGKLIAFSREEVTALESHVSKLEKHSDASATKTRMDALLKQLTVKPSEQAK